MTTEADLRPINCRNRIRDEDVRPYPRSGCASCGDGGLRGCPYERGSKRDAQPEPSE